MKERMERKSACARLSLSFLSHSSHQQAQPELVVRARLGQVGVRARVAAPRVFVRVRERALLPRVRRAAGAGGDLEWRERTGEMERGCVSVAGGKESEGARAGGEAKRERRRRLQWPAALALGAAAGQIRALLFSSHLEAVHDKVRVIPAARFRRGCRRGSGGVGGGRVHVGGLEGGLM